MDCCRSLRRGYNCKHTIESAVLPAACEQQHCQRRTSSAARIFILTASMAVMKYCTVSAAMRALLPDAPELHR